MVWHRDGACLRVMVPFRGKHLFLGAPTTGVSTWRRSLIPTARSVTACLQVDGSIDSRVYPGVVRAANIHKWDGVGYCLPTVGLLCLDVLLDGSHFTKLPRGKSLRIGFHAARVRQIDLPSAHFSFLSLVGWSAGAGAGYNMSMNTSVSFREKAESGDHVYVVIDIAAKVRTLVFLDRMHC